MIIIGRILVLYMYVCIYMYIYIYVCRYVYIYIYTRLASNKIFLPANKIHREVCRAKDLPASLYISQIMTYVEVETS